MSSSGSGTVINYGSGSDFLISYGSGSGSTSQTVTVPTVPVPGPVPQKESLLRPTELGKNQLCRDPCTVACRFCSTHSLVGLNRSSRNGKYRYSLLHCNLFALETNITVL
jgi:hypothetical protein